MAFSAVFCPSCTPKTQSSLLSSTNSPSLCSTTSFLSLPQAARKLLFQPLRHKRVSPIEVNTKRSFGKVKASKQSFENVEVFSKEHLAVTLAHDVSELSKKFAEERGAFTVVLSGGSSVKYLRKLAEDPYVGSVDWSKWHVFLADERAVPKNHLESNYKLVHDRFLSRVRIPDSNIHAADDTQPADKAAEAYAETVRSLVESRVIASSSTGLPKFDLMLLDMGPDGHVASLFSGHPLLQENQKWVSFLRDSPIPPAERITFTLPVINASSRIAIVVSGAGKANTVESVLEDDQKGYKLPVELVSPVDGQLKWYLDKGAASKLFNLRV
ncbi:probable 6-phosphogluconolactonase 4, chloroplastic [Neltuma alba]|uniref:probable 6-phosphogluconolactonase 4, chloroplastic n=1 Tax=Neltuma alba TaxID=207710 RepID=UPI0010A394A6|nr:probable 6-phosphogluconolactonase 4, chloroplastic [Prosopis alba]